MKVRIKDIAEKAGVSAGTVDRVIHNRGKVSEDARRKVLKIIDEMNYEPNVMAQVLGNNKIYRIAALIPLPNNDPYWLDSIAGIDKAEKDLKQYGITVEKYLFNTGQPDSFTEHAEKVLRSSPDGILVAPLFYREALPFFDECKKRQIPVVLFNTQITDADPLSYIGQDSYQSGLLAGRLIHTGQPEPGGILLVHIDEDTSNSAHLLKKEQGFRNYFEQGHLSQQYTIIKAELSHKNLAVFNKEMDDLIDANPKLGSIFVTTSKTYEIAKYLEQRYLKNIKLVGYDLIPQNLHYLERETISFLINQNPKGQGYWGTQHLTQHLVFKKEVPAIRYLPLDIVTRENMNYYTDEGLMVINFR